MESKTRILGSAPALPWAIAFLVGVVLVPALGDAPLGLAMALIGLGVASGRTLGRGLAVLALGLVLGSLDASEQRLGWRGFVPARPVELLVRTVSHVQLGKEGERRLWVEIERWRQGRRAGGGGRSAHLTLPAAVQPPSRGALLRVRGYLRQSRGFWNGVTTAASSWRMWVASPRLYALEQPPSWRARPAAALRRWADSAWQDAAGPGVELARTLLLGDRSALDEDWQRALRRAGLQHLLAVSGLHVGIVAWMLLSVAGRWWRLPRYLLAALGVVAYLALVGPRPSVLRAVLMGLWALLARVAMRPPAARNSLALAAAVLVAVQPTLINDLGFRLSFLATLGILFLGPRLAKRWVLLPGPLAEGLAASTAAQLTTWWLTVPLAGGIAGAAWLLNLLAVPWLAVFLGLAVVWLLLAACGLPGAETLAAGLDMLSVPLDWLAALPAASSLRWNLPPVPWLGAFLGLFLAVFLLSPAMLRRGLGLGALLLLTVPPVQRPIVPTVTMLDVGQGDALLLRDGQRVILVDGGGWRRGDIAARVLLPALAAAGVSRLDAVVLTHPDSDHCHGLRDLIHYLVVKEVWMSPGWLRSPCAAGLASVGRSRWRPLWRGDRLRVGRWRLRVLHPPPGQRGGKANDRSLVLLAEVHGRRLLLTGDIEAATEARLLRQSREELRADLLKVAHHGSKSSTSASFLKAVSPRLALISAGRGNRFGHPSSTVLKRLAGRGIRHWSTSSSGALTVHFRADGSLRLGQPGVGGKEPR